MTKKEVFIQILSEVTGKSNVEIADRIGWVFRRMEFTNPGSTKGFHDELGNDTAQELISKLRTEKEGILNWLIQGAMKVRNARNVEGN